MSPKHSGSKPPALSAGVQALLEHERTVPSQSEQLRARLLSRANEAIRQGPPVARAPRVGGRVFVGVAVGIAAVVGLAAAFQLIERPGSAVASSLAAFPRIVRLALVRPTSVSTLPLPLPLPSASNAAATEPPAPSPHASNSSRREGGIEELQLLSRARQADARGDYAGVLSLVAEHERSFVGGRLSEERDVLRVKALVGLGRRDQARSAAAKFHRQFPRSVLLHKIDEMLASPQ